MSFFEFTTALLVAFEVDSQGLEEFYSRQCGN